MTKSNFNWYVRAVDFPAIPPRLIPEFDGQLLTFSNQPWSVTRDGQSVTNSRYDRQPVSVELEAWIRSNIADDYDNIGVSCMHGGTTNLPHTDTTRDLTLMYLITTGGDDVSTVFYRESGQELYRPRHTHPDYDHLEVLESVRLVAGRWYLINARIVHSVENMTAPRQAVQLGFDYGAASLDQWAPDR